MLSDQDRVFIIGSGAIGKALAVFLSLAGRQVTIIRGSVNDGSRSVERLRVEMADDTILESAIEIATLNTFIEVKGLILLANKSFGNEQLAIALKEKAGESPLVLLQNGLGVERPFKDLGFRAIYRCILLVTSQTVDARTVRFREVAVSPVGIVQGELAQLASIVREMNTPQFSFKSETDIQHALWKKAVLNCVFNSVCPLLEVDNGIFYKNRQALKAARRIISECTAIARAKGIALHDDEVEAGLLQISRLSDGQEISTLQDIRNNRRTEIETLYPEIVRIAATLGKEDSVRETKLLGDLIRIKSDLAMKADRSL